MRIPPITPGTRPELAELEATIARQRGRVSPLYQVLLNSPAMAHGWEQMLTAVRRHNSLPDLDRELLIVRVAVLNHARFEYEAHVPIALQAGASSQMIADVSGADAIGASVQGGLRALVELADAMTLRIDVPDALYAQAAAHYTQQQMVDAMVTIGAYNMVSRFLEAVQIGH